MNTYEVEILEDFITAYCFCLSITSSQRVSELATPIILVRNKRYGYRPQRLSHASQSEVRFVG